MLYTRRGDDGTTKTFGCDQRISKSSSVAEALGTLDEINSFLGICKVRAKEAGLVLPGGVLCHEAVHGVQKNLFIVQAELAGSQMSITEDKVKEVEAMIDAIEKELPPIKSFFISGGSELGATFDFARTLSRRAERRVVGVAEEGNVAVGEFTRKYLNRLSSILYALARFANHSAGVVEEGPDYK
jgi:cob(I)alamin adenosyltransferase